MQHVPSLVPIARTKFPRRDFMEARQRLCGVGKDLVEACRDKFFRMSLIFVNCIKFCQSSKTNGLVVFGWKQQS